ncbi:MAG: tetratricopeptide repeat protein [Gemmataceae bacterium]|nr:tetratricopeptide repeat protein [Gemmataceae bacterium]MCI0742755.1 tetratricopeptide repeat protein [Gemmataceae bacterium]
MRRLIVLALLSCPALCAQAGGTLQEGRQALLRGNYGEAKEIFEALLKEGKSPAAAIGLSKSLEAVGEYDQAEKVVAQALKDLPQSADLHARLAELYYLRGRWDKAEAAAQKALALNDEHFAARWVLGQVLRDRGDLDKADEEFRWFIRTYTRRENDDRPITDPDELLIVGLAGCERARYHNLSDQFEFILIDVWGEAVKKDKNFWPAEYEAGRLYQEKYNKGAAHRALERALAINPRAAEALAAKGVSALQRFETKDAEHFAEQALKINPRLTEALRLRADLHLFAGDTAAALKDLDAARAVNAREESTLARVAACFLQQKKHSEFAALVKEVEKHNSRPAVFYTELADSLEDRKHFDDAEKYFVRAMDLQPKLPWAQNGLGLLYMRLGEEDKARKVLERAFEIDNFNVQVSNTLKVLDHLEKYDTLKTEHFLLRFDPKNDKILANFLAKYLEDIYAELAEKFDYRPKGPILIEVFNKHEMFSGRVVALPDLHTIGACTGRMVAMVSPRDKSKVIGKPFNWNRVMRHELVHIFNLEQTKFQIPHWFTEGLAVTLEGTGTPPGWKSLLAEKMQEDDLLNLDTILLGFIRPRTPDQWHQAYLQSQLYVEYLSKTHGEKAVGRLLAAYADGLDTEQAIEKVCEVKKAEFEKGYRNFLQERVDKGPKKVAQQALSLKALQEAHAKNPEDGDIAGQLADRYLATGNRKDAKKLAEEALRLKRHQPLAAYVKAVLLNDSGDSDLALELLEAAAREPDCNDIKPLKLLARIQFENKKFSQAAETLERCRKLDPDDSSWLRQLAKIYDQAGETQKLVSILKDEAALDPDDLSIRKKLVQHLKGNHADVEKYARQGLEIDVLDTVCQEAILEALAAQNKEKELQEMKKLLEK